MSQTKVQLVNDVIGNSGFGDDSPDRELVVKSFKQCNYKNRSK